MNRAKLVETTEYWMDIYHRFGPVVAHSLSIDKPYDLEVWLHGTISKTWFAPEFILNKNTKKIRAVGMLMGEQPKNTSTPAASEKEFIRRIKNYLKANQPSTLFQGTVLIQKGKNVVFTEAFGLKNIEMSEKNTLDTRMRISSVSKIVTSIAYLQLMQKGLLRLNQPISKYLPELPKHISNKITIYQLLTHTSSYELDGIEGFRKELRDTKAMSEVYSTQLKYLSKWKQYKDFKVSPRYDYSNDSFDLLAIIIEKVSGMSYPEYLKKNIFDVAKMPSTSFSNEGVAIPYRFDIKYGGLMNHDRSHYPYSMGQISGAGGLKSTVRDLRNLFNTLKNTEELIDIPHKHLLFAPLVRKGGREYTGLGLTISYDQTLNFGHNGTGVGNSAEMRYFPKSDFLLIVLCNNRSGAQNLYSFFKNNLPGLNRD